MKKIFISFMFLFVLLATNVFAHTGIKDSYPQKNEVVTTPLSEIRLGFQTKIEIGSSFELKNDRSENVKPDHLSIEKTLLRGTFQEPLANGGYTLYWSIIGADGHPIKGEIPFEIYVPQDEESNDSIQSIEINSEEEATETNGTEENNTLYEEDPSILKSISSVEESSEEKQMDSKLKSEDDDTKSNRILYSGIVVAVITIAILWWRVRKKR
jgi:copper resistance protein C